MSLNLEQKKAIVEDVSKAAASAHSAIAAEYTGLSVEKMTALRVAARNANVDLRVVRNTLARRALVDTDFACMTEGLIGPLLLAFSVDDPGAAARVISDFAKDNNKLVVKLVSVGGKLLEPSDIKRLAEMPTYDQAVAMLMGTMKAPITKLTRTLAEPHAKLVRTVAAIRDQKQASA